MTAPTRLGVPGPRPLGQPASQNGQGAGGGMGAASPTGLTLGTLREVRNELASLGDLLDRMSKEMAGLRRAVETVANRGGEATDPAAERAARKAKKRADEAEEARSAREKALEKRVDKLERRLEKLKRRIEWGA